VERRVGSGSILQVPIVCTVREEIPSQPKPQNAHLEQRLELMLTLRGSTGLSTTSPVCLIIDHDRLWITLIKHRY
jgi:hypothetical protein